MEEKRESMVETVVERSVNLCKVSGYWVPEIPVLKNINIKMDSILMPNEIELFVDTMAPQNMKTLGTEQ